MTQPTPGSAEAGDDSLCKRCGCCSAYYELVPCWSCGGFCGPDYDSGDDEWDDGWCDACEGEGEIAVLMCIGSCDENGKHGKPAGARVDKEKQL